MSECTCDGAEIERRVEDAGDPKSSIHKKKHVKMPKFQNC